MNHRYRLSLKSSKSSQQQQWFYRLPIQNASASAMF
ncbi:Uncharacterised protein [Vibrio cholerae]|nr:Uncharacterised protein [Vibrio cholerae]